jgi:endoglucanase
MTNILKILIASFILTSYCAFSGESNQYVGINIAGAEFNSGILPGKQGTNYLWPGTNDIYQYSDAGFNTIRVPFLWQRIQPELFKPLDENEAKYLDNVIKAAEDRNVTILIDPHNYGAYKSDLIGSESVPVSAFEDFWSRIATRYKNNRNVMFGLMNEPNKQSAEDWANMAQAAIYAIRKTGAKQKILVPGTRWTGAHSWLKGFIGASNAEALQNIRDPANNMAFELHQYFDRDSSGTKPECVSEDVGVERITAVTEWLRTNKQKGFLGEFGASVDPTCLAALDKTLNYLQNNKDVWIGWTYWSGGKWFGKYMFGIYPPNVKDSLQLQKIQPYLGTR